MQPQLAEWTPCSVENPKVADSYLITSKAPTLPAIVQTARYNPPGDPFFPELDGWWKDGYPVFGVLAWAPLPKPWKEIE